MQVPFYIFLKPIFYLLAVIVFWQTVKRNADSRWRFAFIVALLFAMTVALSLYESRHPLEGAITIGSLDFSYAAAKAVLENIGLFAIVSLLLLLLSVRLSTAETQAKLLARIAASSVDAIIAADARGTVISWNLGAQMVFGYYPDEIIGSGMDRLVANESLDEFEKALERCRRDGFVKGLSSKMVGAARRSILAEITLSSVTDETGLASGVSLFVRDVTERRQIETELLQSSKMSAMGTMAAGIVHEFGNLLTVISGRAQLGKTAKDLSEAHAAFEAVSSCAARAKSVTSNLLAYAKRQQPRKSPGRIQDAADAALALLDKELQRADIAVERRYEDLSETSFDHEQITQVFVNLIINALNAMRDAGGAISISTSRKADYIEAAVRDTGPGIPDDVMPNLFEPFSTVPGQADGKPHTGLGLFVCHEIVKFHNGSITVESARGKGSTFKVYLPAASDAEQKAPADSRVIDGATCRAAVIDRDSMIRDLLAEALRRRGVKARTFQDASSAEAAGVATHFDLVFVDVSVRSPDGQRFLQRLKQGQGPIIVPMVGEAIDAEEFRKLADGTFKTLKKPFGLDEVNAVCDLVISAGKSPGRDAGKEKAA